MIRLSNMGLRKKTFIYVGAGLAALIATLTLFSLQTISQSMEIATQERLKISQNIALSIDELVHHLSSEVVYIASTLDNDWLNPVADSNENEHLISLRSNLQHHLMTFHQIEVPVFVAFLDAQGKILRTEPFMEQKTSRSLADIPAIRNVLQDGRVYIETQEAILTGNRPTLSIVAPIEDEQGVVNGLLVADIHIIPGSFDSLLLRWGVERDLEIIDENGFILASSLPWTGNEISLHWDQIYLLIEERVHGITEHRGDKEITEHLVAYSPLEQIPWGVVVEETKGEILGLLWAMGWRLIVASGIAILIATGLIWGFTRQIITPIQRLATVAERFGAGDLEAQIPPMRQDEIGKLAQSFETMRHQLKHSLDEINQWNQELERRVEERTAELETLYEQLSLRDRERGELLGKIITAQEEERKRIARELHDDISQTLTGLVMNLGSAENLMDSDPVTARQALESLRHAASEAVKNTRRLMRDLRPSLLDDLGLVPAISWYVENYLAPAGIETKLETSGLDERLPPAVEITLFRVVQETLTNIVKHAQAKTVHVSLQFAPTAIVGDIEDDGIGFNVDTVRHGKSEGIGLLGMGERIELLKGKLVVESNPGKGTRVHFEIPRQVSDG